MNIASKFFRALLVAQSGITDVCSMRIYDEILPKNYVLPAISFWPDGGGFTGPAVGSSSAPNMQERGFVVRCWAATKAEAYTLYAAVHDTVTASDVHDVDGETVTVRQEGGEIPQTDSETGIFYVQSNFSIGLSA